MNNDSKNVVINVFNNKYTFKIVDDIDKDKLNVIIEYLESIIGNYSKKLWGKRSKEEILLLASLNITYDLMSLKENSKELTDKIVKSLDKLEQSCIS
ncbi:cell division protein ZapA [candidate division WOR-3 bacterium]|jgi:cell division protein ZapA (FtsZ GTPase activity inhibitor)|nr:cell division protein ZapA [candidate division WOR-3 bacterium]